MEEAIQFNNYILQYTRLQYSWIKSEGALSWKHFLKLWCLLPSYNNVEISINIYKSEAAYNAALGICKTGLKISLWPLIYSSSTFACSLDKLLLGQMLYQLCCSGTARAACQSEGARPQCAPHSARGHHTPLQRLHTPRIPMQNYVCLQPVYCLPHLLF